MSDKAEGIYIALLALHGVYGEEGTVQVTLETLGIPYTSSGVLSISLRMVKDLSKRLLRAEGILTPNWFCWTGMDKFTLEAVEERLGYPVFAKPNRGNSSIGMKMAADRHSLRSAVQEAFCWDRSIVVEQYIEGDELTICDFKRSNIPCKSERMNGRLLAMRNERCII